MHFLVDGDALDSSNFILGSSRPACPTVAASVACTPLVYRIDVKVQSSNGDRPISGPILANGGSMQKKLSLLGSYPAFGTACVAWSRKKKGSNQRQHDPKARSVYKWSSHTHPVPNLTSHTCPAISAFTLF